MPKKYSLNVEAGEVVSVEIDGVSYDSVEQIPDEEDRLNVEMMMPLSIGTPSVAAFPIERIVAGIFFLVAAITLSIAAISALSIREELAREVSVPGRVVDLRARPGSDGQEFFHPVVEFDLADGTHQAVELSQGSRPAGYRKDDQVTILYDPDDPSDARIDSIGSTLVQWILPLITGVIGIAFTAASLMALLMARRSLPERLGAQ